MMFALRMAWRETRGSWLRLLFFFLCVALGVAAIVVLRSVVQNVRLTLTREARSLVGADVVLSSPRSLAEDSRAALAKALADAGPHETTDVIDTQTMAAAPDAAAPGAVRLVEVRGIERAFPFYGALEMAGGQTYAHTLLEGRGAVVQPEFLTALAVNVGDTVRLAGRPFTIRGVVTKDRVQRAGGGFAFGPRIYIDLMDLRALGIVGYGSRASHQVFIAWRLAPSIRHRAPAERVRARRRTRGPGARSTGWDATSVAENYLSLVGFAVVVLGGTRLASRVVVQQKIRSVAILKCLGAMSGRVPRYSRCCGWRRGERARRGAGRVGVAVLGS
jgi:putative ABC transport system permease protein